MSELPDIRFASEVDSAVIHVPYKDVDVRNRVTDGGDARILLALYRIDEADITLAIMVIFVLVVCRHGFLLMTDPFGRFCPR